MPVVSPVSGAHRDTLLALKDIPWLSRTSRRRATPEASRMDRLSPCRAEIGPAKWTAPTPLTFGARLRRNWRPQCLRAPGSLGDPLFNRDVGKHTCVTSAAVYGSEWTPGLWSMRPCVWGMRLCNLSSTTGLGLRCRRSGMPTARPSPARTANPGRADWLVDLPE